MSRRAVVWSVVLALFFAVSYVVRVQNSMADFKVYRTAADRAVDAEPLYRETDGDYQYKYFPAFALVMAPFALIPDEVARAIWFAFTCMLVVVFVALCIRALPDRRRTTAGLAWAAVLLMGRWYAMELDLGQTNVLLAVVLVAAFFSAQANRRLLTGLLAGIALFIKPYALITVPWLWFAAGWPGLGAALATAIAGLVAPALVYGWFGNLEQLSGWYATVTGTTPYTLVDGSNISFASTWSKWLGVGQPAIRWSMVTGAMCLSIVAWALTRRRQVAHPSYLEFSALLLLIPLLSPQGWTYVLLLGTPAVLLLVDRWPSVSVPWRVVTALGIGFMSYTLFDVFGRKLYYFLMSFNTIGIAAFVVFIALINLRFRKLA